MFDLDSPEECEIVVHLEIQEDGLLDQEHLVGLVEG